MEVASHYLLNYPVDVRCPTTADRMIPIREEHYVSDILETVAFLWTI